MRHLRPHHQRGRTAADPPDPGGHARQSDQGGGDARAQSQHLAQEDPGSGNPGDTGEPVNVAPSSLTIPPPPVHPPPSRMPPPPPERRSRLVRLTDILLGKSLTIFLVSLALAVGISSFVILARGAPPGLRSGGSVAIVLVNLAVLLLLGTALAGRLTRVWVERRRGSAGSRLHVRLVLLYSGVAVTPAIVVACFA